MTGPHWIETFNCPKCGKLGQAELVEVGQFNNRFEHVPASFKAVTGQYGSVLHCETCNIPLSNMK